MGAGATLAATAGSAGAGAGTAAGTAAGLGGTAAGLGGAATSGAFTLGSNVVLAQGAGNALSSAGLIAGPQISAVSGPGVLSAAGGLGQVGNAAGLGQNSAGGTNVPGNPNTTPPPAPTKFQNALDALDQLADIAGQAGQIAGLGQSLFGEEESLGDIAIGPGASIQPVGQFSDPVGSLFRAQSAAAAPGSQFVSF